MAMANPVVIYSWEILIPVGSQFLLYWFDWQQNEDVDNTFNAGSVNAMFPSVTKLIAVMVVEYTRQINIYTNLDYLWHLSLRKRCIKIYIHHIS